MPSVPCMPELIKADPQETVPLEEFLPVKSLIYVFAPALEFKYAIVNLCVPSSLPPPDANPVAGVKRAGTARLVGGVDTEGLAGERNAQIPPGVKFLGGLEALVLSRPRLASAERRWERAPSLAAFQVLGRFCSSGVPCLSMALLQT